MKTDESEGLREFPTTHWSQIFLASQPDQEAGLRALDRLLRDYERPLLVHLRHKFRVSEDQARDWLQGFVEKKILGQRLLSLAKEEKGRFRAFVRKALENYIGDEFDRQNSRKRNPTGGLERLDEATHAVTAAGPASPVCSADYEWAWTVIERAKERTRAFYDAQGTPRTWAVFCEGPLTDRQERPSNAELARRHGFASAKQVEGALITAQRQFGKQLRAVVAETVKDAADIEAEIRYLIAILSDAG
jgi:hypothetical protein